MSDLLASGAAWLADQLAASASRSVTYYRGTDFGEIIATIGTSRFEAQNSSGVVEQWESRDFVVKASALPFGEPRRHDRIVDALNGVDVTYDVVSPAGVPLWHYGDAFRQTIRIHTVAASESSHMTPTLLLRFWGAFVGEAITDQQITASLSKDLGGSRAQSRSIAADGEYLYVVLPASFGVPVLTVNGLVSTAWETTQRSIAFTGQAARTYAIYRSTYQITGTASLVVS